MTITKRWLIKRGACEEAIEEFQTQKERDAVKILRLLIKKDKLNWANWLIVRIMTRKQYLAYAIFAAEQVINIYEKKRPIDIRPRLAIEAAKKVLKDDSKKNRNAAYAATDTADAAAYVYAAYAAAYAAADTADAAAYAYAAYAAAYAFAYANGDTKKNLQLKILKYGIKLLEGL